ncbi:MAG: hypothetical protein CSA82_00390 [Actinobacteria bacterium]|nr:MAG: hypothetical protein CSA82_00390 [Actinomycetota bacterium]
MSDAHVDVLLFSDDADTRRAIMDAIGERASKDSPKIEWHEAATAYGVEALMSTHDFAVLILDGEATKEGGFSIARELANTYEELPPIIALTARSQDTWLATWAGAVETIEAPYDPLEVQEKIAQLLRSA